MHPGMPWPRRPAPFAYIGAAWVGSQAFKEQLTTNIQDVVAEHVKGAIGRKEYRMAPLPDGLQSKPVSAVWENRPA